MADAYSVSCHASSSHTLTDVSAHSSRVAVSTSQSCARSPFASSCVTMERQRRRRASSRLSYAARAIGSERRKLSRAVTTPWRRGGDRRVDSNQLLERLAPRGRCIDGGLEFLGTARTINLFCHFQQHLDAVGEVEIDGLSRHAGRIGDRGHRD